MTDIDLRAVGGRALDQLGSTADTVADQLRALDIKGEQKSEHSCPVAVYLTRLDGIDIAEVNEAAAYLFPIGIASPVRVPMPLAVQAFVQQFDAGIHLDLVQTVTGAGTR